MVVFTKWLILLQLLEWLTAQTVNPGTLKSVQIMFRHGIRGPDLVVARPTGRLTQGGKKQMYDLGLYYRQRYGGLIKNTYDENDVLIVSSDFDRTIQSASLVAFGLYKDFNMAANWNKEENIQFEPIPVRTIPRKYDNYIQLAGDCPRRKEIQDQVLDAYFDRYLQDNRELVDYYYNSTGDETIQDSSKGSRNRFNNMVIKQEEITMNLTNNLPIVDWAQPLLQNQAFLSVETGALRELVVTAEQKRLNTGPLLQYFIENMDKPADARKKIYLLSGHDRTIELMMLSLGIEDPNVYTMPPTGSSFMIELHEAFGLGARPYVQIWFRNDTRKDPHLLQIPNCGNPCYLSTFKTITREMIAPDFEALCIPVIDPIVNSFAPTLDQLNITFFATFIIFILVVIGVFQIIRIKRKNYATL